MIITIEEQKFLLDWIFRNEHKFIYNSAAKYIKFFPLKESEDFPILFSEIKERILEKENILNWETDSFFGDIIMFNEPNGFIHEYIDSSIKGKEDIRFDLFLSKPIHGGDPIYDGELVPFEERMYLKYNVNRHYHASLPVIGNKPRICVSYGILIDEGSSPIG